MVNNYMTNLYPHSKPRILVVDDNPIDLEFSAAILGRDYDVTTATCGISGLLALAKAGLEGKLPDGVLSDFEMPGFDGDEFLAIVRGDRSAEDTAARYFDGDRQGIGLIHQYFHGSLGRTARPVMLYSSGIDLKPYLSRGANGILDKGEITKHFGALLELVAIHVPLQVSQEHHRIPTPNIVSHPPYMAATRRHDSGLIDLGKIGPQRRYGR